jgi:hypothetical protein
MAILDLNTTISLAEAVKGIGGEGLLVLAVVLIAVTVVLLLLLKKFVVNAVLGVVALFVLNLVGIKISLSLVNIVLCAILGPLGIGLLVLLSFLGIPV